MLIASAQGIATRPYWRFEYPDAAEDGRYRPPRSAIRRRAARAAARRDAHPAALRRAGRRLSQRRARFLDRHRRDPQLRARPAAHLLGDLRDRRVRRERVPAGNGRCARPRALDHAMPRRRHRRCASTADPHTERPILRTAPAPLLLLSRLVRDSGFKVVLTGEGADEVFAGYDIFKEAKVRRFCAAQPDSQRRPLLLQAALSLPAGPAGAVAALSRGLLREPGATTLDDPLFSHLPRFRTDAPAPSCSSPRELRAELGGYDALAELRERLPADFAPLASAVAGAIPRDRVSAAGLHPLVAGRSRGMAHAVEGRFPFLDHRVVEFAARIPPRLKLRGLAREAHPAREHDATCCRRQHRQRGPSSPTARRTATSFVRRGRAAAVLDRHVAGRHRSAAGYFDAECGRQAGAEVRAASRRPASATTWRSSASSRRSSGTRPSFRGAEPHRCSATMPYAVWRASYRQGTSTP